jgi:hypothetical protein
VSKVIDGHMWQYSEQGRERERLTRGGVTSELVRRQALLERFVPLPAADLLDQELQRRAWWAGDRTGPEFAPFFLDRRMRDDGRNGNTPDGIGGVIVEKVEAEATGFEPAISALTGLHVRPLHHASSVPEHTNCASRVSMR